MGTVLYAIIETYSDPEPGVYVGGWTEVVSGWYLGKDYKLMSFLHENATKGWPNGSDALRSPSHETDGDYDGGRWWCDSLMLKLALEDMAERWEKDPERSWRPIPLEALCAAVSAFEEAGQKARVLWFQA
jgi:hypothetical protein